MLSGIFSQTPEYRRTHMAETPDSLLADGLQAAGIDVTTAAPHFRGDWRDHDIVHLNHLTNACVRALLPARQRIVFTHHASGWKPWTHRVVRNAIERRADRVVVFTEDERRRLEGRVPDHKVDIIRYGLDVQRFTFADHRRPAAGEPWDLLYVGQLVEFKRVHLALRLLRRMIDAGHPARLRIVSHRETLRPELEVEAARLGVSSSVFYLGPRTRDDIAREMATAHFLVLPSYREGLSTVTSEAAMTGLPVLLFDVSGADEQVPVGWERPAVGDVERWLALALQRVAHYGAAARAFRENSAAVRDGLSIDRMVAEHIALYRRLMAH